MSEEKSTAAEVSSNNAQAAATVDPKQEEKKSNPADATKAANPKNPAPTPGTQNIEAPISLVKDIPLIRLLKVKSPEIDGLVDDIQQYSSFRAEVKARLSHLKELLKPVPQNQKKLKGRKAKKTTKEERKGLKVEAKHLESQLLWIDEHLELSYERLRQLSKSELEKLNVQKLKDKANSKAYTKRNMFNITNNLLNTLNGILTGDDFIVKTEFNNVRRAAFLPGENGNEEFNSQFAALLKRANEKVGVLCSGKLKKKLYQAARLTLQLYDPKDPQITEIIFPEEEIVEEPIEVDPLIRNKGLITAQVLGFLNHSLEGDDTKTTLKNIFQLSKNDNDERFFTELDNFIFEQDAELYILCSGELKNRLYKVFQLTLQQWDQNSRFEEIIFPAAENNN